MVDKGETVGAALRTKSRVQPIYVSPGHLVDLAGAIDLTLACDGGYRQPEPTRRAHLLVNALRRGERAPSSEAGGEGGGEGEETQGASSLAEASKKAGRHASHEARRLVLQSYRRPYRRS